MLPFALLLGLVWGVVWAVVLQCTQLGRFAAQQRTWLTVAVGVGGDLLIALLVVDWAAWLPVVGIVAASSVGIVVRSLRNEQAEAQELLRAVKDQAGE